MQKPVEFDSSEKPLTMEELLNLLQKPESEIPRLDSSKSPCVGCKFETQDKNLEPCNLDLPEEICPRLQKYQQLHILPFGGHLRPSIWEIFI